MKNNTGHGCGCNDHKACPPMPAGHEVKSKSTGCDIDTFLIGGTEETVVLADVTVETLVEADIHLPTFATDIKNIRKNVHLTQCKATPDFSDPFRVKLFVEGFVHKNIQFVDGGSCVRDFSVNVPFRCFDFVDLINPVAFPFGDPFSSKDSGNLEIREISKDGMSADRCNFGSITFEINNEPIKCKLLASQVDQWDILSDFDNWGRFNKITEKMNVVLFLKLSQKQQVAEPSPNGSTGAEAMAAKFKKITRRR
ncbi:hypothetical protein AF332_17095 [Sporosarcina globispora]|uniref:SipL SPOCS domain-containing protein n=1 Tax=Sporosarcina globispora TaxID=1459 RepID=A0A0M0GEK7_SPOGL|nr:hypothetical protein [Sporosarcina globispora]KON88350.1 hypothetical protein AF332_17095 [Sporosarcina globispora]